MAEVDYRIKIAGFGGQGVLLLGEVLAEAGLEAGYEVSWLPAYGPEMRSGTSNCQVRISSAPIDSPLVSRPDVLIAMNEPSLRKFLPAVAPDALVLYNGASIPEDCARAGVRIFAHPFTEIAGESPKAANMAMLGAFLEITGALEPEPVAAALRKLVKNLRWLDLDLAALQRGQEALRPVPALFPPPSFRQ